MYKQLIKDKKNRKLYKMHELRYLCLKSLSLNQVINLSTRYLSQVGLIKTRLGSIVKVKNRCNITGRSRSVLVRLGVSRYHFRTLNRMGKISGFRKKSW